MKKAPRLPCIICDGHGAALCQACQKSYDKVTKSDDGTVLAIIRWAATRAADMERKRSKEVIDLALRRFGAAVMVRNAMDELIKVNMAEKMGRLDAAFAAVRAIEKREAKRTAR